MGDYSNGYADGLLKGGDLKQATIDTLTKEVESRNEAVQIAREGLMTLGLATNYGQVRDAHKKYRSYWLKDGTPYSVAFDHLERITKALAEKE